MGRLMHCPEWVFDVAVTRVASEFLASDLPIETFANKYANGLSERYGDVDADKLLGAATPCLEFLSEVEAGDMAVELLEGFSYFRLYFERIGVPRKLKVLFGAVEDPVKKPEIDTVATVKAFRAYVFRIRSNTGETPPAGWQLGNEDKVPGLAELTKTEASFLDAL